MAGFAKAPPKKRKREATEGPDAPSGGTPAHDYVADVLVTCSQPQQSLPTGGTPKLVQPWEEGLPSVVPMYLSDISELATIRMYLPKDLRPEAARRQAAAALTEAMQRVAAANPQTLKPSDDADGDAGGRDHSALPKGPSADVNLLSPADTLAHVSIPTLDPKTDLRVSEPGFKDLRKKRKVLQ